MTDYILKVFNPSGTLKAVVTDFLSLKYINVVNDVGQLVFTINSDHPVIDHLENNAGVEVWRRNAEYDIEWTREFWGLFKDKELSFKNGKEVFQATCVSGLWLLSTRINAYPAMTTPTTYFYEVYAEGITKLIVYYNATSNATTINGRVRDGAIPGLSVDETGDGTGGTLLTWHCAWANVLKTIQEIALVGGGDFDLVKTSDTTYEFRWYEGQLGTDRTSSVLFALERGNMANPVYKKLHSNEKTVAIAGGFGEREFRLTTAVTGTNYSSGNDVEMFHDDRNITTEDALQNRASMALEQNKAVESVSFDILQTPGCLYGKHYFLGDLVSVSYFGTTESHKVVSVAVAFENAGKENISIKTERVAT